MDICIQYSYISFFLSYPYLTNPPENSKPLCGSSMDIFRNCTMESHITTLTLMTQLIFYKIDLTINATTKRE